MDAAERRPQLPALSYLDVDKVKREEEAYQNRNLGSTQSLPPVTSASPTFPYPPGPPPPYSQPPPNVNNHVNATSQSWSGPLSSTSHQAESRRTSGDEHDTKQSSTRQSLPSISEALGVDSQTSFATSISAPQPSILAHQSHPQSAAPASPLSAGKKLHMEPPVAPPPPHPTQTQHPSYPHFRPNPEPHSYAPFDPPRPAGIDRSPLHVQTGPPSAYPPAPAASPNHDSHSAPPTSSMPPPSSFPYGYTPYPPRYAQPTPPASSTSGPIYQPSANYPAPHTPPTSWKATSGGRYGSNDRMNGPGDYSASVKRHLDLYDLGGALNEISSFSGILLDFSRRYGDRLHQTARTGTPLTYLPGLVEVDDMIAKSRMQVESMLKIREVILAQQAAYDQQIADQRSQQAVHEPPGPEHGSDGEDGKNSFPGQETKKRRGRAAPPGRCHSCNRAETPEWRRGPDGARTLCNACGLHYAKLTRKQQGANKSGSAGGSSLRPKEN